MGGLDSNGLAIAEAKAAQLHHAVTLGDFKRFGYLTTGGDNVGRQQPRARRQGKGLHFVGEAGEAANTGNHGGRAYKGAAAMLTAKHSGLFKVSQGMAKRDAGNCQHVAQAVLIRDLYSGRPLALVNQAAQAHFCLVPQWFWTAPVRADQAYGFVAHAIVLQFGPVAPANAAPTNPAPA